MLRYIAVRRSEIFGCAFFLAGAGMFGLTMVAEPELMSRTEGLRNTFLLFAMSAVSFKKWIFNDRNHSQFFPVAREVNQVPVIANSDDDGNYLGHLP